MLRRTRRQGLARHGLSAHRVRVLLSDAGVILILIEFQGRELRLSQAMRVAYLLAHGEDADEALVPVPPVRSAADRRRFETASKAGARVDRSSPLQLQEEEWARCLHLCFGYRVSEFDRSIWPQRTRSEYLLTYLLALHQAVGLQDLSWRSWTGKDGSRNNDALVNAYLEFTTDYDFAIVSPQFNIQRLYRAARTALGVDRLSADVREELLAWIENEQRRGQSNLNTLAILAFLAGLAIPPRRSLFWGFSGQASTVPWWPVLNGGLFPSCEPPLSHGPVHRDRFPSGLRVDGGTWQDPADPVP